MLFVLGVGQRLQVVFIAGESAHILGWGAAFPSEAVRILYSQIRQNNRFQQQVMPPAIAEVVQVLEVGSDPRDNLPQPHSALVNDFALVQIVVRVRHAIDMAPDLELVEVIIFPAHDDLQDAVQLSQDRIFPDQDAPPDGRLKVLEGHLELI